MWPCPVDDCCEFCPSEIGNSTLRQCWSGNSHNATKVWRPEESVINITACLQSWVETASFPQYAAWDTCSPRNGCSYRICSNPDFVISVFYLFIYFVVLVQFSVSQCWRTLHFPFPGFCWYPVSPYLQLFTLRASETHGLTFLWWWWLFPHQQGFLGKVWWFIPLLFFFI